MAGIVYLTPRSVDCETVLSAAELYRELLSITCQVQSLLERYRKGLDTVTDDSGRTKLAAAIGAAEAKLHHTRALLERLPALLVQPSPTGPRR